MAIDNKYGRVTLERGAIGEDEPVVVFRAQDTLLPKVLMYYHLFCMKVGSPPRHLDLITKSLRDVQAWQKEHHFDVKIPSSDSYRAEAR
jgi:hypothetical protein